MQVCDTLCSFFVDLPHFTYASASGFDIIPMNCLFCFSGGFVSARILDLEAVNANRT